jgi:hypothetical protein
MEKTTHLSHLCNFPVAGVREYFVQQLDGQVQQLDRLRTGGAMRPHNHRRRIMAVMQRRC